MKETRFIAQNKEKWLESENLLKNPDKDPEKLSNLFTQVVDDLSYSRTYYPNRSVRVYLNKIAREYFSIIYGHKREKKNRFRAFWLDELPQIILFCRRPLLISLIVFTLSACIGVFSAIKDPQFTSSILGEAYVEMTKANIEKGDPMAVYKKGHQLDMFLGITFNNLMVAFRTYVFGVFLSIGTLAILLYNGVMVGCFQYFFVERGLLAESALTIWLHGTLEISSIILAGGAGLTLGSGLLFPGTYSRLQAFQLSAMRSLKLMLGVTPIFVLAAIIESFLTRYTEVPDFVRLLLILLSAAFIVGYFVIFPWMKARKGFEHPLEEVRLPPTVNEPIQTDRIKNSAEIIKDAFGFYKKHFNAIFAGAVIVSAICAAIEYFVLPERSNARLIDDWWQYILNDLFYALKTTHPEFIIINSIATALILARVVRRFARDTMRASAPVEWISFLKIVPVTALVFAMLHYLGGFGSLILVFTFGVVLVYAFVQHAERIDPASAIGRTLTLSGASFGSVMGVQLILLLIAFSFLLILSAPLIYLNTAILKWNVARSDEWANATVTVIELFVKLLAFNMVLPILAASGSSLYFSLKEIQTAEHLKKNIAAIGTTEKMTRR